MGDRMLAAPILLRLLGTNRRRIEVWKRLLVAHEIVPLEADGNQIRLELEPLSQQIEKLLPGVVAGDARVDDREALSGPSSPQHPLQLLHLEVFEANSQGKGEGVAVGDDSANCDRAAQIADRRTTMDDFGPHAMSGQPFQGATGRRARHANELGGDIRLHRRE